MLHLLEALQLLQMKVPGGGARRHAGSVSGRSTSSRSATSTRVCSTTPPSVPREPCWAWPGPRDQEPEIALAELEKLAAKGEKELAQVPQGRNGPVGIGDQEGAEDRIRRPGRQPVPHGLPGRRTLWKRVQAVRRAWCGSTRSATRSSFTTGSVFVTAGTDRRSQRHALHARSLTEPIVQYTLEPLVYVGPAEGMPKDEWKLQPARELLDLKICDMACGSGAFLVQACRYLSERLLEAWEQSEKEAQVGHQNTLFEKKRPGSFDGAHHALRAGLAGRAVRATGPARPERAADLRSAHHRPALPVRGGQEPAGRRDGEAVALAADAGQGQAVRVSGPRHPVRRFAGRHRQHLDQLRYFNLDPSQGRNLFTGPIFNLVDDAVALRQKIEAMPSNTVEDVEAQEKLLAEAKEKTARLRCAADLLLSVEFQSVSAADKQSLHDSLAIQAGYLRRERDHRGVPAGGSRRR